MFKRCCNLCFLLERIHLFVIRLNISLKFDFNAKTSHNFMFRFDIEEKCYPMIFWTQYTVRYHILINNRNATKLKSFEPHREKKMLKNLIFNSSLFINNIRSATTVPVSPGMERCTILSGSKHNTGTLHLK
jgi:hypothetical protein